jgi:hypothetical protein
VTVLELALLQMGLLWGPSRLPARQAPCERLQHRIGRPLLAMRPCGVVIGSESRASALEGRSIVLG